MLSRIIGYTPCVYMYTGIPTVSTLITRRIIYKQRILGVNSLEYAVLTNNYYMWRAHNPTWSHYNEALNLCIDHKLYEFMSIILDDLTPNMYDEEILEVLIYKCVKVCGSASVVSKLCMLLCKGDLTILNQYPDITQKLMSGYSHIIGGKPTVNSGYINNCINNCLYEELDYVLSTCKPVRLDVNYDINEQVLDILLRYYKHNQYLEYQQLRHGRNIELSRCDEMELFIWLLRPQVDIVVCSYKYYDMTISLLVSLDYVPQRLSDFYVFLDYISVNNPEYYARVLEEIDLTVINPVTLVRPLSESACVRLDIYEIIE